MRGENRRPERSKITLAEARAWQRATYGGRVLYRGKNTHSPCPVCNDGEDRFRIGPNPKTGLASIHCSVCGAWTEAQFLEVLDLIRGESVPFSRPAQRKARVIAHPAGEREAARIRKARNLFGSGEPVPGAADVPAHPCNLWAQRFGAQLLRWPAALRWMPTVPPGWTGCGSIVAAWTGAEGLRAVQRLPLRTDGKPGIACSDRGRGIGSKRSDGVMKGAACIVSDPPEAAECWITEGLKDALALASMLAAECGRAARVAAIGSARADVLAARYAAGGKRITLAFDAEAAGYKAGKQLAQRIRLTGRACELRFPPDSMDWADFLQSTPTPAEVREYLEN